MVFPSRYINDIKNGCDYYGKSDRFGSLWNRTMEIKNFTVEYIGQDTFDGSKNPGEQVITLSNVLYDMTRNQTQPLGIIAIQYKISVLKNLIDPVSFYLVSLISWSTKDCPPIM